MARPGTGKSTASARSPSTIPSCQISIEYKPDEPRAQSLLRDAATTLLAIAEAGAPNLGVTMDFAHALYAGEQPAFAAHLIHRRSRLLGVHLNDGYAKRDDGLMVGAVHLKPTLELLRADPPDGYDGALYFDTFPDASGLDPVAECEANIATVRRLLAVGDRLDGDNRLGEALGRQDAVASQRIVNEALIAQRHRSAIACRAARMPGTTREEDNDILHEVARRAAAPLRSSPAPLMRKSLPRSTRTRKPTASTGRSCRRSSAMCRPRRRAPRSAASRRR